MAPQTEKGRGGAGLAGGPVAGKLWVQGNKGWINWGIAEARKCILPGVLWMRRWPSLHIALCVPCLPPTTHTSTHRYTPARPWPAYWLAFPHRHCQSRSARAARPPRSVSPHTPELPIPDVWQPSPHYGSSGSRPYGRGLEGKTRAAAQGLPFQDRGAPSYATRLVVGPPVQCKVQGAMPAGCSGWPSGAPLDRCPLPLADRRMSPLPRETASRTTSSRGATGGGHQGFLGAAAWGGCQWRGCPSSRRQPALPSDP